MPKFVVYEVWTRARVVEADDFDHAYTVGEPRPLDGLNLSNWHVVATDGTREEHTGENTGALNYRQVE